MAGPSVRIDLEKIERNTAAVVSLCNEAGISVTGVTKVCCGMPQVARAMIRGGVESIGESRLENIHRLRASGITCPIVLLRIPPLSEVDEIVSSVDISLNSEVSVIRGLSEAAEKRGLVHQIILMVDLGDLREGIWPDDLGPVARETMELPGVKIVGLGVNLTCYGGVLPSPDNMRLLLAHARQLEYMLGYKLRYISGGNTSTIPLLRSGKLPDGINHLRIGEGIILGKDTIERKPIEGAVQDACVLSAEVIELKSKPSIPIGRTGQDAFGHTPHFQDQGIRMRAILNIGREDAAIEGLRAIDRRIKILGASSDHLLTDVSDVSPQPPLGGRIEFEMDYGALLAVMTSAYVQKELRGDPEILNNPHEVAVIAGANTAPALRAFAFEKQLKTLGYTVSGLTATPVPEAAAIEELAEHVRAAVARQAIPLVAGSDPAVTFAALRGMAEAIDSFGLIWIDPLPAFKDPALDDSLTVHNLLSTALGFGGKASYPSLSAKLSPENTVLIGIEYAEAEEAGLINHSRIPVYTMEDVDALGIREVMRKSLRLAAAGTNGVLVHFNPAVVENIVDDKNPGGLTFRETHLIMEMIARSGLMRGLVLAGIDGIASQKVKRQCASFVLSGFGKKILGR